MQENKEKVNIYSFGKISLSELLYYKCKASGELQVTEVHN